MTLPSAEKKKSRFPLYGVLGVLLLLIILYAMGTSISSIWQRLIEIKFISLFWIVVSTYIIVVITSIKWQIILKHMGFQGRVKSSYYFFYCSFGLLSATFITQAGNYVFKVASLKDRFGVPASISVLSIFYEQIFDLIVLFGMIVPSLLFLKQYIQLSEVWIMYFLILLLITSQIIANRWPFLVWINRLFSHASRLLTVLPGLKAKITQITQLEQFKISPAVSLQLLSLSIVKYFFITLRVFMIMLATGLDVSYGQIYFAIPSVQMVVLLGLTPNGLGVSDMGWSMVLLSFDMAKPDIGNFLVIERIVGTASILFVTLIGYLIMSFQSYRRDIVFRNKS